MIEGIHLELLTLPVWSNVRDHMETLYLVLHVLYDSSHTHCNVSILYHLVNFRGYPKVGTN